MTARLLLVRHDGSTDLVEYEDDEIDIRPGRGDGPFGEMIRTHPAYAAAQAIGLRRQPFDPWPLAVKIRDNRLMIRRSWNVGNGSDGWDVAETTPAPSSRPVDVWMVVDRNAKHFPQNQHAIAMLDPRCLPRVMLANEPAACGNVVFFDGLLNAYDSRFRTAGDPW